MDEKPWAWVPIVSWCVISGFIVANLFIAVICESLMKLDEIEKTKRKKEGTKNGAWASMRSSFRGILSGGDIENPKDGLSDDDDGLKDDNAEHMKSKLKEDIASLGVQQEKLLSILKAFGEKSDRLSCCDHQNDNHSYDPVV